jgi:hypothetical protein
MLQLQEVSEKALFCATKGSHLGARTRPTQDRYESDGKQFPKVVAGVTGARIRDVVEGG